MQRYNPFGKFVLLGKHKKFVKSIRIRFEILDVHESNIGLEIIEECPDGRIGGRLGRRDAIPLKGRGEPSQERAESG